MNADTVGINLTSVQINLTNVEISRTTFAIKTNIEGHADVQLFDNNAVEIDSSAIEMELNVETELNFVENTELLNTSILSGLECRYRTDIQLVS